MADYDNLLSPSTLNKYLKCPYSFYLDKIRGIKVDGDDAATFGKFIHKVNENFWDFYTPRSNIEEAIKQSVSTYTGENINSDYDEPTHLCLNNFASIIGETPDLIPLYRELRCENTTNNTVAIIDVVYPSKIVDYKTSTQYTVNAKLPNKIQATMCSQNLLHTKGIEIRQVEFWYLRYKKYQRVTVTPVLVKEVDNLMSWFRECIEEDKFPKNESDCFMCSYKLICDLEKKNLARIKKRNEACQLRLGTF